MFLVVLAVAVLMFWLARNLLDSRTGRALTAIRDHPMAASTMGINVAHYKAIIVRHQRALHGRRRRPATRIIFEFVAPDSFRLELSISLLVGMVVGGIASLPGAIIGGVFVQVIEKYSDALARKISASLHLPHRYRAVDHLRHRADRTRLRHADRHRRRAGAAWRPSEGERTADRRSRVIRLL